MNAADLIITFGLLKAGTSIALAWLLMMPFRRSAALQVAGWSLVLIALALLPLASRAHPWYVLPVTTSPSPLFPPPR